MVVIRFGNPIRRCFLVNGIVYHIVHGSWTRRRVWCVAEEVMEL